LPFRFQIRSPAASDLHLESCNTRTRRADDGAVFQAVLLGGYAYAHGATRRLGLERHIAAFSSDAIPIHLLTKEAMALYVSRLAPGGAIVFHISNMNLSLSHVLARIADDAGLQALWQHEPPDAGSWQAGKFPSEWLIVARDRRDFGTLTTDKRWRAPMMTDATPLWTDDFSSILSVLKHNGD
jgi:hypothetical protein